MDRAWWLQYQVEARGAFQGEMWAPLAGIHGVRRAHFLRQANSGAGAIALAAAFGATRILLLGYDGQKTGGRAHWHPDHPKGLGNAGSVRYWPEQFRALARSLPHVQILNCTRETAVDAFPRVPLEEALCSTAECSGSATTCTSVPSSERSPAITT